MQLYTYRKKPHIGLKNARYAEYMLMKLIEEMQRERWFDSFDLTEKELFQSSSFFATSTLSGIVSSHYFSSALQGRHSWKGPPSPGPFLDFGFQYALIRNNRSKKIGVEYWALPGSNSPWRPCIYVLDIDSDCLFWIPPPSSLEPTSIGLRS